MADTHTNYEKYWLNTKVITPSGREGMVSGFSEETMETHFQVRFTEDGATSWEWYTKKDLKRVPEAPG